ncbi:site-specific integrase [Vibrio splendidus]|uniref:Site-specific recombinase n=1 Tax=Vibrio splendidus TaxID=29497 RepID=A0A2T5DXE5_VIBSP|nr:site-specific integrase [Vibrio splendidus]OEE62654.1 site-specific recombinase [Vibrio splendidus FF-6]PTP11725.1 site-specific recombinase [Vibrio splendidus]
MASQFMQAICEHMTMRGYSRRTIKAYCYWIKYYIHFHKMKHPEQMHAAEVVSFLSHLANHQKVAINTQKVALNALAYLYNQFIKQPLKSSSDIRTVQELLGHSDVKTTQIYTHVIGQHFSGTTSPLDHL